MISFTIKIHILFIRIAHIDRLSKSICGTIDGNNNLNAKNIWRTTAVFHRCGAPSVSHQAPRFPLVREQGPKGNKTSSIASQRQCLIDLRSTHALGKFTTENIAIALCKERICWTSKIAMFALFFLLYSTQRKRKRVALKKNKLNHIVRLP